MQKLIITQHDEDDCKLMCSSKDVKDAVQDYLHFKHLCSAHKDERYTQVAFNEFQRMLVSLQDMMAALTDHMSEQEAQELMKFKSAL